MSNLCLVFAVVLTALGELTVALSPTIPSQTQNPRIESKPTNCENHIAILDVAHQDAGQSGLIIMIGRLGDGERNRQLNQNRLHSARAYLTEYHGVRSPKSIVIAEGGQVSGYGRLELYIGGKLHTAFAIRRNADLSVGSCEPPELDDARQRELRKKLYPWLYQKKPPKSRNLPRDDEGDADYNYDDGTSFYVW